MLLWRCVSVFKGRFRMMRDNASLQTVLHYFAAAADRRGRYSRLLDKVLALPGVLQLVYPSQRSRKAVWSRNVVCVAGVDLGALDNELQTPYTLAHVCGNQRLMDKLVAHPKFGARSVLNIVYHTTGGNLWRITPDIALSKAPPPQTLFRNRPSSAHGRMRHDSADAVLAPSGDDEIPNKPIRVARSVSDRGYRQQRLSSEPAIPKYLQVGCVCLPTQRISL